MDRPTEIAAQNVFSFVHPLFYEPLTRFPIKTDYVDRLKELVPEDWRFRRDDIWMHVRGPGEKVAQPQGFKIHVSCTPQHAHKMLGLVVPELVASNVDFKIAADPSLLRLLNSKLQGRGQSGKFMTIYPRDVPAFKRLIAALHERTREQGVVGPYILSDKRYKDSKVLFYRYGGFRPPHRLNIDGTKTSFLVAPDGTFVPDDRRPFFTLPEWVSDPFAEDVPPEGEQEQESVLLNDRYQVDDVLGFSNAGGIYLATDTRSGQPVIIKEARPHTHPWTIGERHFDATDILKREYSFLRRFEGLGFVPQPVDFFYDWEHAFLVESKLEGMPLSQFWAQDENIMAPYIRRRGVSEHYLSMFKHVARSLFDMLEAVHERGVLLGDVSPGNVMIHPETLKLGLIDFESAAFTDDSNEMALFAADWGTVGFAKADRKQRARLTREDDYYAMGMTLYFSVIPSNSFFNLNPPAEKVFLQRMVELGVPGEIKELILALREGRVLDARALLARWG